MKSSGITVSLNGDVLAISRKKHKNTTYLSLCDVVRYNPDKKVPPVDSCQNYIRVPDSMRAKLSGKYCTLVNRSTGGFIDVIVDSAPSSKSTEIEITRFIERTLKADPFSELILCCQHNSVFSSVKIQSLDNIKSDIICLPEGSFMETLKEDFCLFEIINTLTNDSIFVRSKYLTIDKTLKSHEIRINKKQRNMLSDNIPTRLTSSQWNDLIGSDATNAKVEEALTRAYAKDGTGYTISTAIDEMDYDVKASVQKHIKANFGEELIIRPVLESFRYEKKRSLYRKFTDFFVGKSSLSLNCRRPHECDENADIVRMTENNMQFLGIEPMDKVVIQYKETAVVCHVLPFSDDKFGRTNTPSIIELSIGIPAHIRSKLNITDIQSSVKVDRDTQFIFKKSFNEQLVPIILTLLSLKFFEQTSWYMTVILVAILVPIVMYITLSSKRNMRGK